MSNHNFTVNEIYNLDEIDISSIHVPPKIICAKGIKQVGRVTSGERGMTVAMIVAVNAIGNHVSPMLMSPRVHFKNHMLTGALQLQLEVQTEQVGQMRGSLLTI